MDTDELHQGSSAAVLDGNQPEHRERPAEAEGTDLAKATAARASKMYVIGAAKAVAPGLPPLASQASKALVKATHDYMQGLPKAHIDALSTSFGNFDRKVGLGWHDALTCLHRPWRGPDFAVYKAGLVSALTALAWPRTRRVSRLPLHGVAARAHGRGSQGRADRGASTPHRVTTHSHVPPPAVARP